MTPEQVKQITEDIVAGLDTVADVASGIDPALKPFVLIGKAVAAQVPGITEHVTAWIEGNPPTDAEKAEFAQKLAVLGSTDSV